MLPSFLANNTGILSFILHHNISQQVLSLFLFLTILILYTPIPQLTLQQRSSEYNNRSLSKPIVFPRIAKRTR